MSKREVTGKKEESGGWREGGLAGRGGAGGGAGAEVAGKKEDRGCQLSVRLEVSVRSHFPSWPSVESCLFFTVLLFSAPTLNL